jgi:hypothetical protein
MKNYWRNTLWLLLALALFGIPMMAGCDSGDNGTDNNQVVGKASEYLPLPKTLAQVTKVYFKLNVVSKKYSGTSVADTAGNTQTQTSSIARTEIKATKGSTSVLVQYENGTAGTITIGADSSLTWNTDNSGTGPVNFKMLTKELKIGDEFPFTITGSSGTGSMKVAESLTSYTNAGGTYSNVIKLTSSYSYAKTNTWQAQAAAVATAKNSPLNVPYTYTENINETGQATVYLAKGIGIVGIELTFDSRDVTTKTSGATTLAVSYYRQVGTGTITKTTAP